MEIRFEVEKVRFRNETNGYTVADVKILEHPEDVEIPTAERIVTGLFPAIHKKDEFNAEGNWIDSGKYGYQFKTMRHTLIFPETSKGMVAFLSRSVKGVGTLVARRIVEHFKEDTFQIILKDKERLLEVKGITEKKMDAIYKSVSNHKDYEEVALFLLSTGLSHIDVSKIYEEMGYTAISKISSNPYSLLSLPSFSFKTADMVAFNSGFPADNNERIYVGIMHFLQDRLNTRGDMYTKKEDVIDELNQHLTKHGGYREEFTISEKRIKLALEKLEEQRKIVISGDYVYVKYFYDAEESIVKDILRKMNESTDWICSPEMLVQYLDGKSLADNQKKAVHMALFNKLSILSGGPGTGKTHTINAIIQSIEHFSPNSFITLCAPTGRAAKRMTEMTGRKAETIHRMMGIMGGDGGVGTETFEEVDTDFLIIDESSMIDAHIFHVLLKAVTDRTRILLVGDYNQLPSVGPGLILRDLMESTIVPVTVLNEIFRQAKDSQIITNSYNIINGKGAGSLTFDPKKKDFSFIKTANTEEIIDTIIRSIKKAIQSGIRFDEIQVLTVLNKGDLGVKELNRRIQRIFNPKSSRLGEIRVNAETVYRVKDRVMQIKNNYDLNVFNGEIGKIDNINVVDGAIEVVVDFGDRDVTYSDLNLGELTLAYAMSVHKSQGSEFNYVIMPIHKSLKILLNRNIIYTGWTRAKKSVLMIGEEGELADGVDRIENTVRNSQIKNKLMRKHSK